MYDKKRFLEWTAPHAIEFYKDKMAALVKQMSELNQRVIIAAVEWPNYSKEGDGSAERYLGVVEYLPETKEIVTTVDGCEKDDILKLKQKLS